MVEDTLNGPCCMIVMQVSTEIDKVNVIWDTAATISLITTKAAERLNLKPKREVNLTLEKTGGIIEEIESKLFEVPLKKQEDDVVWIEVYSVEKITTSICAMKWDDILSLFTTIDQLKIPNGEVYLLIGMNYAAYHLQMIEAKGQMVMYKNSFGMCLGGSHPLLKNCMDMVISHAKVNHIRSKSISPFFDNESLGTRKYCEEDVEAKYSILIGNKDCTIKEYRELILIDQGLKLKDNRWCVTYPWVRDPYDLPDNRQVAYAKLCAIERRLKKNPAVEEMYKNQMNEMVNTRKARQLSSDEMERYNVPVHYIAHREILNPNSLSTPCRLIYNPSAKFHGHSLNEYWAKGPDFINNLLAVFIRFYENHIGMVADIKRMYHSINISALDQHVHRFLWRKDSNRPPNTYVMLVVSFGDKPAGAIASLSIRKTALNHENTHPRAYNTLTRNIYVDDILDSTDNINEAIILSMEVDQVLNQGGISTKKWTISGQGNGDIEKSFLSKKAAEREESM